VEDHDRLIIQSGQNLDPKFRPENPNEKSNKMEIFSALSEGAVLGSVEVCRVEKGQIALNITDNLCILINLEPIENSTMENNSKNENKNVGVILNENSLHHHEMSISEVENNPIIQGDKMIADSDDTESTDDKKWLNDLFSCSLLKAQMLLLEHWTSSLEIEREKKEKEAAAAAAAAALAMSSNKPKSIGFTASVSTNNSIKERTKESIVQVPKKKSSESSSASLLGLDVSKRLADSALRSRIRDVGDGITLSINRSQGDTVILFILICSLFFAFSSFLLSYSSFTFFLLLSLLFPSLFFNF
jgi:hypothetical protein